jgi:hypothetical protein
MSIVTDEQLKQLFMNLDGDDYLPCITNNRVKRKNLEQTYNNPDFRKIALAKSTDSDFDEGTND